MTVASTITRCTLDGLITLARLAASMLCASSSSMPTSPRRLRQRDRLEGSIGGSVCKCVSTGNLEYCYSGKYGVSCAWKPPPNLQGKGQLYWLFRQIQH